jgi:hypothetical protein
MLKQYTDGCRLYLACRDFDVRHRAGKYFALERRLHTSNHRMLLTSNLCAVLCSQKEGVSFVTEINPCCPFEPTNSYSYSPCSFNDHSVVNRVCVLSTAWS